MENKRIPYGRQMIDAYDGNEESRGLKGEEDFCSHICFPCCAISGGESQVDLLVARHYWRYAARF